MGLKPVVFDEKIINKNIDLIKKYKDKVNTDYFSPSIDGKNNFINDEAQKPYLIAEIGSSHMGNLLSLRQSLRQNKGLIV